MSSDPIRGTTEIPQAVRQSTRMPPTLPWLTDSAVTGSLASRKAALQQFNESMDTWWRRTRAAVKSDYEELAAGASSAIAEATSMSSALRTEVQERTSQNETIVAQIQALVLNSGNSRVFIQTEAPQNPALYDTWFDTDDGFHEYVYDGTGWVDVRDGAISGAIAAVGTEQTARLSADSVLAGRIDSVVTRMTNAETGITGLNTALDAVSASVTSQGDSITAQGTRITSLESSVNTANTGLLARVATIEGTYATDAEVSAAIASEVSARNGAISSAVSTETSARVAADGAIHARWGVAIDVNGAVVGRVQLDGTNQTSAFTVDASKFTVWNGTAAVPPFQVIGGQVRVANLSLISADITDRSLANIDSVAATKLGGISAGADVTLNAINGGLTITSGGVTLAGTGAIKSSNFSAGSSGWGINANGDAEFNSVILRNPLTYYPLAAPTLSKSQLFANSLAVAASAGAGQTIRYTSDGSSVTASSTEWPKSGSYTTLTITDSTTLKIRAFNGTLQSDEVSATYTKNNLVVANLTNDSCTCPAAFDGSSPLLTNATTTMAVYLGITDDSANWAFTAAPSSGVTGSLAGRVWTTTGFTVDSGYVDISATKSGVGTVVKRFALAKAKAGAPGAPGAAGTSSALVSIYKRSATVPDVPSTAATFTFATGVLSGHNNGWTQSVPANDGNPVYVTTAIAAAAGASDTIVTGEWAAPVVHAANGANGANGTNGTNGVDGIPAAPNMLQNSDFVNDVSGWTVGYNPAGVTNYVSRADASSGWGLAGAGSLSHYFPVTPANGQVCDVKYGQTPNSGFGSSTTIPVVAGQRYQASAYLGVHRLASAVAMIAWWDAAGTYITEDYGNAITAQGGGTVLSGYGRSSLFATAPANAAFATFGIRSTFNGGTDCYLFATRCFFGDATATQTQPSPWMPAAPTGVSPFTLVNAANCTVGPNWIQRTNGGETWDASAHTLESYVGAAFLSFRAAQTTGFGMVALNFDPATNNSYDSLDFAWQLRNDGTCGIYENGGVVASAGTYSTSTVFAIVYDGKQVQYLMDGVVKRTVAASAGLRLFFDSSLYTAGAKVTNIAFGPSGAAGANGADATAYWLVASSPTIKLSGSTFSPATLTFTGKAQVGAGAPGDYACRFLIAESTDGTNFTTKYTSASDEAAKTYTPSASTVLAIRCRLYLAGGAVSLLDEETVNVVVEQAAVFAGGSAVGGGAVGNSPWTVPSGMTLTLTVPSGARSVQFSGQIVNTGTANQSIKYGIRVGGTVVTQDQKDGGAAGHATNVALSTVVNCSAGAVSFEIVGYCGVNNAMLTGQFIVL